MKFTTATIAAATMALASAQGCNLPPVTEAAKAGDVFKLVALPKVANEIECAPLQAKDNGLLIGAEIQASNCTRGRTDALFTLNTKGDLFLYTGETTEIFQPQQIYVDRSGMGQGIIQYTTGVDVPIGRNQERGPFKLTDISDLLFDAGNGLVSAFQACPPYNGDTTRGWDVWLAGDDKPAGKEGCVEMNARAVKETPEACQYSVYKA